MTSAIISGYAAVPIRRWQQRYPVSPDPACPRNKPAKADPADQAPHLQALHSWPVRMLLRLLAIISLCLGVIGVFLPGLPTTVFVLIAAWAAARSSPSLHAWLLQHYLFGPVLDNWNNGRCVSRRAKRTAALVMTISALWLAYAVRPIWLAALPILCMAIVLLWLWRRPEPPRSP